MDNQRLLWAHMNVVESSQNGFTRFNLFPFWSTIGAAESLLRTEGHSEATITIRETKGFRTPVDDPAIERDGESSLWR